MLDAYELGAFAQLVGFRFGGVEVIDRIKPAEGALFAVAKKHVEALSQRSAETVDLVTRLDAILEKNGVASPGQPKTLEEYTAWAQAIRERTLAATEGDVQAQTAFHVGHAIGDATATASLGSMVEDLLSQAPDHPYLRQQADVLNRSRANARKQLELVRESPALPESARVVAREAAGLVVAPVAEHVAAARSLRAMVKAMTPLRERLLEIFRAAS